MSASCAECSIPRMKPKRRRFRQPWRYWANGSPWKWRTRLNSPDSAGRKPSDFPFSPAKCCTAEFATHCTGGRRGYAGTRSGSKRCSSASFFGVVDVEAFHYDAGFLAARVGVAQFGGDAARLAGHQGDVAVAVDGGEDAVAGLFAHGFQTHHERRVLGRVGERGGEEPAVGRALGGGRHVELGLGERAQGAVVFFFDTAPVEIVGDQPLALAEFQADEMDRREAAGVLHLEGRDGGVFHARECGGLLPFHGAIGIEKPVSYTHLTLPTNREV